MKLILTSKLLYQLPVYRVISLVNSNNKHFISFPVRCLKDTCTEPHETGVPFKIEDK